MCGLIGGRLLPEQVQSGMDQMTHRGPDGQGLVIMRGWTLGHVRLAIQDLTEDSAQPVIRGDQAFTYNGELWNPQAVRAAYPDTVWQTTGDTEPLVTHLMAEGLTGLRDVEGMFALAWTDGEDLLLARDTYGEVPLHYGFTLDGRFAYGSEVAPLLHLGVAPRSVRWVPPGGWLRVTLEGRITHGFWADPHDLTPNPEADSTRIRELLRAGSLGRMTSDRSVAVLCSGGLDSSAILGLLVEAGHRPEVYTAVYDEHSSDLRHARKIAAHLGLNLTEVKVPPPTRETLAKLVRTIEMPHKAQVEIAVACDALASQIAADGHAVLLSGEGSDELWASYGMSYHGIKREGWHNYRRNLFLGQHRKNFARTNKVFMRHSIEARLPFLHPPLVRYGLGLTQEGVTDHRRHIKAILVEAVEDLLPHDSAWRAKVAFQTGAGLDKATAQVVASPKAFYRAEYLTAFRGVPT